MNVKKWVIRFGFGVAYCGLISSVVMDTWLWFEINYFIPSWTMALMSFGIILLLIVLQLFVIFVDNKKNA